MSRVLELFAGCGGMALAWHRAGAEPIAFVERDPFARRVLARHWPDVPQHDDVVTFDASRYRGRVDVLSGGPPCQPVSRAGLGLGMADDRWLWGAFVAAAAACEAPVVVAENPPALLTANGGDAFYAVLCAFGDAGYAVEWDRLAAGTVGAPHRRDRVWIVASRVGPLLPPVDGQPSMLAGRPASWPSSGRWHGGRLTVCAERWSAPRVFPWQACAGHDFKPGDLVNVRCGCDGCESPTDLRGSVVSVNGDSVGVDAGGDVDCYPWEWVFPASPVGLLPTPSHRDHRDPNSAASQASRNAGCARGQQLPNHLADAGIIPRGGPADDPRRLAPELPEWMMGMPLGWTRLAPGAVIKSALAFTSTPDIPEGSLPPLLDAEPQPWLPDLTAELALTTEREHRRPRLRCVGNSVCVPAAERIARLVVGALGVTP